MSKFENAPNINNPEPNSESNLNNPEPNPSETPESVKIPFMITKKMRRQLIDMGLSDEEISKLRPADAWEIINGKKAEGQQTEGQQEEQKTEGQQEQQTEGQQTEKQEQKGEEPKLSPEESEEVEEKLAESDLSKPAIESNLSNVISSDSKSIFEKMSDKAKKIASTVYEGVYQIPVAKRIVGKMEIAYKQKRIDIYDKKMTKRKNKLDAIDNYLNIFQTVKKELPEYKEELEKEGVPGAASLEIQLKKIIQQKEKFLNKRDEIQTKFEAEEKKRDLFIEKRDAVAKKLIDYYEEKLKPYEQKIESFSQEKAHWEQLLKETESQQQKIEQRLKEFEDRTTYLEELYQKLGWSERKIKNVGSTKEVKKFVADRRKQMRLERESIEKEILKNQKQISKLETKANPYFDKKQAFVRVTERQKIDYKVRKREGRPREEEIKTEEKLGMEEEELGMEEEKLEMEEEGLGMEEEESRMEEEKEKVFEKEPEFALGEVIDQWNNYLKEEYGDAAFKTCGIEALIFAKETGLKLDQNYKISEWNHLMKEYLNLYQKVDAEKTNYFIEDFNKKLSKEN